MAARPTFDLDTLKQLVKEHPDWTLTQFADALTADNRSNGRSDVVTAHNVSATFSRLRAKWAAEGIETPVRRRTSDLVSLLTANTGVKIPDALQDQTELRRLRHLSRLAAGLEVGGHPGEGDRAREFERMLRRERKVVDLYPDGTVFLRAAAPWEIDDHNRLLSLVASYRPPTHAVEAVAQ